MRLRLPSERCEGNDAWHLPTTIGPVAIAYNLGDTEVNLKTETLAKIFQGRDHRGTTKRLRLPTREPSFLTPTSPSSSVLTSLVP